MWESENRDDRETWLWDASAISEGTERVSHLDKDAVFYGHLSIYELAAPLCREALVLDAGSGAGYGSALLADSGARHVYGVDASARSVEFSQYHFGRPNLEFREMRVECLSGFPPGSFDLIFTSNTLEHVPDVTGFLRGSWKLLKPTGTLLVAVPPITNDRLLHLNLVNPHHLNLWSPRQWFSVLCQFFVEVIPYLHGFQEIGSDLPPTHEATGSKLDEKSFVFEQGTVDDMYEMFTLTSVFIAKKPRPESALPPVDAPLRFVDESFTRPFGYIPPDVRRRLRQHFGTEHVSLPSLFGKAVQVVRSRGVKALTQEIAEFARQRFSS